MSRKDILPRLPIVFGYSAEEASVAIGISVGTFRKLVQDGSMPQPKTIGSRRIWCIDELRAAFKALPHVDEVEIDTWADVV